MSELQKKLGLAFKAERERRDLDIDTLSDELKISVVNLTAIESGDSSELPSDLYYKLFTKSYAERLGIDLTATIEAIKEEIGLSFDSDSMQDTKEEESNRPDNEETSPQHDQSTYDDSQSDTSLTNSVLPLAMGATIMAGLVLGLYVLFVSAGPTAQARNSGDDIREEIKQFSSQIDEYNWNTPALSTNKPLTLTLRSLKDSWATVLADGDTVIYRNITPGRDFTVQANYRFLVSIGVPSVVTSTLNGRIVNLRNPESRRISRVEINQINSVRFPQATPAKLRQPKASPTQPDSTMQAGERF